MTDDLTKSSQSIMSSLETATWVGVWAAIAQSAFAIVNYRLSNPRKSDRSSIEKLRNRVFWSKSTTFSHTTHTKRFFSLSVLLVLFYTLIGYCFNANNTIFWFWVLAITVYHWNLAYLATKDIIKNRISEKQSLILMISCLTSMVIALFHVVWLVKIFPICAIAVVAVSAVVSSQTLTALLAKPLGKYRTVMISASLAVVGLVVGSVAQRAL